mgnify:CR=1 FL=1
MAVLPYSADDVALERPVTLPIIRGFRFSAPIPTEEDVVALSTYYIAMVPTLPEEHHAWLAQYAGALLLRKVSAELSEKYKKALQEQLMSSIQPEVSIRQMQDSIPVEPFSIPS